MKITNISMQKKNNNRLNIFVDEVYRFSLDAYQVVELGVKIGREYDESDIIILEQESQFGKLYSLALEYCLMRPHSSREILDYLNRKIRPTRDKTGKVKPGFSPELTKRVFDRLIEKKYIDDYKFASFWIENRNLNKGISKRKLVAELKVKGINSSIIESVLNETARNEEYELQKVINKKRSIYSDNRKFILYLMRQGFLYEDIKKALE